MFATGVTMGLAEWIIDDTCLIISFYTKMTFTSAYYAAKSIINVTGAAIALVKYIVLLIKNKLPYVKNTNPYKERTSVFIRIRPKINYIINMYILYNMLNGEISYIVNIV